MGKPQGAVLSRTSADEGLKERQLGRAVLVEVFCGSGALSAAASKRGWATLPVDWAGNRYAQVVKPRVFDLTSTAAQQEVLRLIATALRQGERDAFLYLSPPCTTATRAREIAVASSEAPKQLRSQEQPWGLRDVNKKDAERLAAENELFRFTSELVSKFHGKACWVVENPASSYFWELECAKGLADLADVVDVDVTACNFGSRRPKRPRLRTNCTRLRK